MNNKLFILILLIFAITPNLGFFTFPSFLILSFILLFFLFILFSPINNKLCFNKIKSEESFVYICLLILFYSVLYYGGLYQNNQSLIVGYVIFFILILSLFLFNYYRFIGKYILPIVVIAYLLLSIWTIINSPNPSVDTFHLFKEAPLSLLQGKNPYNTLYSVYPNVKNYFPYLPFSLFFVLPFNIIFGDPRFSIIFANLFSFFLLYKLSENHFSRKNLIFLLSIFLFLPRSFYILEHMYLDPIIISFFILFVYLFQNKNKTLAFVSLGLFFSFKQHLLILLLPFFLLNRDFMRHLFSKKNFLSFCSPFILVIIFFLLSAKKFIGAFIHLIPNTPSSYIGPTSLNLSFTNFLSIYILPNKNVFNNIVGVVLFTLFFIIFMFFRKKSGLVFLMTITLFFFQYFTYMSFHNHYFFIALLIITSLFFEDAKLFK